MLLLLLLLLYKYLDFHQEYRWDGLEQPQQMALVVELFARATRIPLNYMESPPAVFYHHEDFSGREQSSITDDSIKKAIAPTKSIKLKKGREPPITRGISRVLSSDSEGSDRRTHSFWNRNNKKKQREMQAAEAAAAVARILIDEHGEKINMERTIIPKSDYDVTLRSSRSAEHQNTGMTEDVRLGYAVIPLIKLQQVTSMNENDIIRLEQWHQLETDKLPIFEDNFQEKPNVLLEISIYSPGELDESENELEEECDVNDHKKESFGSPKNASFSRRMSADARGQSEEKESTLAEIKSDDPVLEQGVVDFLAVVGCKDIGNQRKDDGMKGWVRTTPDCVVLEQFPPDDDFHIKSGRKALLPGMVQWFCFPEGTKIWRGTDPPSHTDLNLKRFSASSPPYVASSVAAFDACLNCTTSFSWFVIASNSDEYGSSLVKTYGAVIRFYVPAPTGIDPTQDDFAHVIMGNKSSTSRPPLTKRLWVPIGICFTSNLPIIGVMEALLLRLCEELSVVSGDIQSTSIDEIRKGVMNITLNYQKPLAGAVNCSIPFLAGDRFLLSLPPPTCLPPLPHGRALVSVCRLLGAEGLNYIIAAALTECKILFHSEDIADIAMVAEVITALIYPFKWSLPYIPILPLGMIEFVEAPLSCMLGIPSCNLKQIDHGALDDTVVVDLNRGFSSSDYSHENMKSKTCASKHPYSLPGSVSTNLSTAIYKLLRAEEEIEEQYGGSDLLEHSFPRLKPESIAEREFRVTVAIEICGLLRGYQDCIGTVFNRDKFLKNSPVIYEEKETFEKSKGILTRSKRFLSMLVNGQNFQQLLENLESDEAALFHKIMEAFDELKSNPKSLKKSSSGELSSSSAEIGVGCLMKFLQKMEDKVPTFCIESEGSINNSGDDSDDEMLTSSMYDMKEFDDSDDMLYYETDLSELKERNIPNFTTGILAPIKIESAVSSSSDPNKQAVSMDYLTKLEKTPWQYSPLLNVPIHNIKINDKIKLREAIGDRRFQAWMRARDKISNHTDNLSFLSDSTKEAVKQETALDLTTLVTSAKNDLINTSTLSSSTSGFKISSFTPAQQRIAAAKGRDIIRRCLDRANIDQILPSDQANPFVDENGRDLMVESEKALRNRSVQLFLLSILAQRSRLENKRPRTMQYQSSVSNTASRLDDVAFDCLVRLSCAMLDACMYSRDFELAYRLLTNSSGFIMVMDTGIYEEGESEQTYHAQSKIIITIASRIGLHPIFAELGVWEAVMALHLHDWTVVKKSDEFRLIDVDSSGEEEEEVEYEAAVATLYEMVGYGIPGEELSCFAMRVSQEHGWFCDDRGRHLLMLARRISIRRDQANVGRAGDIGLVRPCISQSIIELSEEGCTRDKVNFIWKEFGWCHPAAPISQEFINCKKDKRKTGRTNSPDKGMKRSAVTTIACVGPSGMVVSGGLDGGVFLAHRIVDRSRREDFSIGNNVKPEVKGIHLDWGRPNQGLVYCPDGAYGVGAVSCLAAVYDDTSHTPALCSTKDTIDRDRDGAVDVLDSMEGSRIVAGTTAGELRVWTVKDIYSSIIMMNSEKDSQNSIGGKRLKYSLRGRALPGHFGGVTCIHVPSQLYRPDSLITGGADGLVKLWSLRAQTCSRSSSASIHQQQRSLGNDALNTLDGHKGRILCVKTAWHSDHLLSGGADRTIRVWDLNGNKCIHRLHGHFGWITNVQYWGPNTIVSASTDRSVALWDARVRNSPLFILRHHRSPISDLLVGSRTDPYMVSGSTDGAIATWDFRILSDSANNKNKSSKVCNIIRRPSTSIQCNNQNNAHHLARSVTDPIRSFLSVGSDAILRKWDVATGDLLEKKITGHCDLITSLKSFSHSRDDRGFITSSFDGTIRMSIASRR